MRELTTVDLSKVAAAMQQMHADPLATLLTTKRLRLLALQQTAQTLESELRVLECFSAIRSDWRELPCRKKLLHVLRHDVAFAPSELAALCGEPLNTVRSTLMRMRRRGEVRRTGHGRWVS